MVVIIILYNKYLLYPKATKKLNPRNELTDKNNGANENNLKGIKSIGSSINIFTKQGIKIFVNITIKIVNKITTSATFVRILVFLLFANLGNKTVDIICNGLTNNPLIFNPKSYITTSDIPQ